MKTMLAVLGAGLVAFGCAANGGNVQVATANSSSSSTTSSTTSTGDKSGPAADGRDHDAMGASAAAGMASDDTGERHTIHVREPDAYGVKAHRH